GRDGIDERRQRRRLKRLEQHVRVVFRRTVENVARVELPGSVFQTVILADAVLRPRGVVEGEPDARLRADAVEGPDGADRAADSLVAFLVGIQVIENVQQRRTALVLREIEQRAMRALDLGDPAVRSSGRVRFRGCGRTGLGSGHLSYWKAGGR